MALVSPPAPLLCPVGVACLVGGLLFVFLALCARVVFFLLSLSCWGFLFPSVLAGCWGLLPRERHVVFICVLFELMDLCKRFQ